MPDETEGPEMEHRDAIGADTVSMAGVLNSCSPDKLKPEEPVKKTRPSGPVLAFGD